MRELDFSRENIRGGWEGVKDFWGDGLREKVLKLVKGVLGRVLREEVKGVVGCRRYQRSKKRKGYRNGFYERGLLTDYSWIEGIKVPRVRDVSWTPSVWSRYQRRQKALDRVILESFLLGHSTRKAVRLFKRVFKGLISAQTVSNIVKLLDGEVEAFRHRRFEKRYRVLIIDGLWIKVASPFPVWKVVLVALGVREDGKKELLSFQVVPSEKECYWWGFLSDLRNRGLKGKNVEVIVHDGAGGLNSAVAIVYPGVKVQRCVFHKISNLAQNLNNPLNRSAILQDASQIYAAETLANLRSRLKAFSLKWQTKEGRAVKNFLKDFDLTLTYWEYPEPWRTWIRTTNPLERFLEELQRRITPMRKFPNSKSAERILYGLIFYVLNENSCESELFEQDIPATNNFTQLS